MTTREAISAVFDRVAESYDRYDDSPVARRIKQLVLQNVQARSTQGHKIVDVGCGPGTLAIELASLGFAVTALDISQKMLSRTSRLADEARLSIETCLHDIDDGPIPGAPFDGAVATMGPLNYTSDPSRMLSNLRRSMAPGGYAWLALARAAALPVILRHPRRVLAPVLRGRPVPLNAQVDGAPLPLFVWDPRRFVDELCSGWELVCIRGVGHAPRLPTSLNQRVERWPGLRRLGSVSFLELRAG